MQIRTRSPSSRWPWLVALALPLALAGAGCSTSSGCTELTCEGFAQVTIPATTGAYDLVIEDDGEMITARCLDPSAPETANNPPELTCDGQGFVLDGHPLASSREVRVTVIPLDDSDPISGLVRLDAIDEITPNGPDCPPLCVIRNGRLVGDGG